MNFSVLVVDDKADSISLIIKHLRDMNLRENVYSAPNGKVALEIAVKHKIDLVLTDWDMPEMNGLELVKALKSNEATSEIPVIMITAVMTEPLRLREAFDNGVHDFLRKPFSQLEFFARVGNAIKLDNAYKDIKEAKKNLQELNSLKDKIFSIISHDIKAPLASLSSLLGLIINHSEALDPEEAKPHYEHINMQVENVMTLLENLLEWSRWQLKQELHLQEVRIRPLVNEIFQLYNKKAEDKGLELANELEEDMVIDTDPNVLSFVFRNLIANALKFTAEGEITVRATLDGTHTTFSVSDTGIGMSTAKIQELFKGGKLESAKGTDGEPGTGIGLIFCQEYIRKFGGKMKVSSKENEGSTFTFTLPNQSGLA